MKKKLIFILFSLIIAVLSALIFINIYMCHSVKDQIVDESSIFENVDCILVLGAGVKNGQPTPMLNDRLQESVGCVWKWNYGPCGDS